MTDFTFTVSDIEKISLVLGNASGNDGSTWTWKLSNPKTRQAQVVALHNNITFGPDEIGSLVVVQTIHGYFELHRCSGYVLFEPDEVIFISSMGDFLSGMVVGRQCVCSMFTPIRRKTLSTDLTELDPAILMSAMQLSLAEAVL